MLQIDNFKHKQRIRFDVLGGPSLDLKIGTPVDEKYPIYRVELLGDQTELLPGRWLIRELKGLFLHNLASELAEVNSTDYPHQIALELQSINEEYRRFGIHVPQFLISPPTIDGGDDLFLPSIDMLALVPELEGTKVIDLPDLDKFAPLLKLTLSNAMYLTWALRTGSRFLVDVFKQGQHMLTSDGVTLFDVDFFLSASVASRAISNHRRNMITGPWENYLSAAQTPCQRLGGSFHFLGSLATDSVQKERLFQLGKDWYALYKAICEGEVDISKYLDHIELSSKSDVES